MKSNKEVSEYHVAKALKSSPSKVSIRLRENPKIKYEENEMINSKVPEDYPISNNENHEYEFIMRSQH
jgi:hypothetical protein